MQAPFRPLFVSFSIKQHLPFWVMWQTVVTETTEIEISASKGRKDEKNSHSKMDPLCCGKLSPQKMVQSPPSVLVNRLMGHPRHTGLIGKEPEVVSCVGYS